MKKKSVMFEIKFRGVLVKEREQRRISDARERRIR